MSRKNGKRLGELLVERGLIDEDQLSAGLDNQRATHQRLGSALVRMGFLSEANLAVQLSMQTSHPCVNVDGAAVPANVLRAIPRWVALEKNMLPLKISHGALYVAVADPDEESTLRWARAACGMEIVPMIAPEFRLKQAIRGYYGAPDQA